MIRRTGILISGVVSLVKTSKLLKTSKTVVLMAAALTALCTHSYAVETESIQDMTVLLYPYHALLVSAGLLALLAGMITARYMKRKKWWLKAHKTLGIAGASLTAAGFALAVYMVSAGSEIQIIREPHAYIGIAAFLLALFTPAVGFIQLRRKDRRLRTIHRWSGRLAILLMLINVYLGLMMVQAY